MRGWSFFTSERKRPTPNAERPTPTLRSPFGFFLHSFRHLDSEKVEPALQNSPGKVTQGQTRTARRFLRFQNGASFVECVEAVGQLEQIICQNVWPKPIQHLWNDFSELTQTFRQIQFGGIFQRQGCSHRPVARLTLPWQRRGFTRFTKDRADPDVRILQIWRGVPVQRKHPVP